MSFQNVVHVIQKVYYSQNDVSIKIIYIRLHQRRF